jgi:hypothetical protein
MSCILDAPSIGGSAENVSSLKRAACLTRTMYEYVERVTQLKPAHDGAMKHG